MAPLTVGAVVGRFQVPALHDGHVAFLQAVQAKVDHLVVLVGVSVLDGYVAENPLTFYQRQALFAAFDNITVLPLPDDPSNAAWSAALDAQLAYIYPQEAVTLYGGRDSFRAAYS